MSEIALRTVGLGKMYHIGAERPRYRTLRDTLANAVLRPLERIRHPGAATHASEEFWALKDVNLEVKRGEVLGIIGRNGAGKSTLLKVMSRITEPTEGRVEVRGRVASLLEVGTGFHPELTGRENIQLNGAILGMTRAELRRKFDAIADFSGVTQFLDTPVKHYSSGMYVRLAFSVAAHLEPEVLIVDEVLSVGDSDFQKRSLGKMEEVAGSGRTVLLVSHNLQAIRSLCRSAIELRAGRIVNSGDSQLVVGDYLAGQADSLGSRSWEQGQGPGDSELRLVRVDVRGPTGEVASLVATSKPIYVRFEFDLSRIDPALSIGFDLLDKDGAVVLRSLHSEVPVDERPELGIGRNSIVCTIPAGLLNNGRYYVSPRVLLPSIRWIVSDGHDAMVAFEVDRDVGRAFPGARPGVIAPILPWHSA
jgi:lipopolysaccharide transport system ATP-binding protein